MKTNLSKGKTVVLLILSALILPAIYNTLTQGNPYAEVTTALQTYPAAITAAFIIIVTTFILFKLIEFIKDNW